MRKYKGGLDRTRKIAYYSEKAGKIRQLFQKTREITGKLKINTGVLKSELNKEEIEKYLIIKRWKEYTEELYPNDPEMEREFVEMPYQYEPTVIRCEVEKALKESAGRKAVGVDDSNRTAKRSW
jgi:hypothetical protein